MEKTKEITAVKENRITSSTSGNRNQNIDILKAVCAIMIVSIHTSYPGKDYLIVLSRIAVPCFFMISGFLMWTDDRLILQKRVVKTIKHITVITIWATLLYAAAGGANYALTGSHPLGLDRFAMWIAFNLPLFGGHLWYLFAYLYVLGIICFCNRKGWLGGLHKLILPLLVACMLLGPYSALWFSEPLPYYYTRNFLFTGMPFFLLGMWVRKHISFQKCQSVSNKTLIATIVLLLPITVADFRWTTSLVHDWYELYPTVIILAIAVLLYTVQSNNKKFLWLARLGEKYSLYIYIYHLLILYLISAVGQRITFIPSVLLNEYSFFIVLPTTICCIWVWFNLRQQIAVRCERN